MRPRDRERRRGHADQAGAVRRARRGGQARRDPGDEHVDPAGRGVGDGRPAGPSGCAASTSSTRRRRCAASRSCNRSRRARPRSSRGLAFAERCGKEPIIVADHAGFVVNALLLPVPQQRRQDGRTAAPHRSSRSTPRCAADAASRWARSRCSTWSASTRRWRSSTALHAEFGDANYVAAPTLRADGERRAPRPQDGAIGRACI